MNDKKQVPAQQAEKQELSAIQQLILNTKPKAVFSKPNEEESNNKQEINESYSNNSTIQKLFFFPKNETSKTVAPVLPKEEQVSSISLSDINKVLLNPNKTTKEEEETVLVRPTYKEQPNYSAISQLVAKSEQFINIAKRNAEKTDAESTTQFKPAKKSESTKFNKKSAPIQASKTSNLSKSEINLRRPNDDDDDDEEEVNSLHDNYEGTARTIFRSSSLERSSSALATVNSSELGNTSDRQQQQQIKSNQSFVKIKFSNFVVLLLKDVVIYENLNPESMQKASKKGYLERKHFGL